MKSQKVDVAETALPDTATSLPRADKSGIRQTRYRHQYEVNYFAGFRVQASKLKQVAT